MPREYNMDAIEIFNTQDGQGNGFVNIHMPVEAAKELVGCFEEEHTTNSSVAKRLNECIEATEDDRNYQGWVVKDAKQ